MKVAVAYEPCHPLVIEDLAPPAIGARDVLVRVSASGICHSDLNVIAGRAPVPLPIVPGHEGCGIVEEVGPEVSRVEVGDRVVCLVVPVCGVCWWCANGMSNHCELAEVVRTHAQVPPRCRSLGACAVRLWDVRRDDGGARGVTSPLPVETQLPDEQLALIGCAVTTGVGAAINTAGVVPRSSVAVIGCGGVGQSVVQGARISGASTIIAIDPVPSRREASIALGATHAIDPTDGNPVERVRELTSGRGADYTFEAVGQPQLMVQAFEMARNEGTVTFVGMPSLSDVISLPALFSIFSGRRLVGSLMGGAQMLRDIPRLIRMAEAGQLDLGSMVSHRLALEQVNEGIEKLERAEGTRAVIT